MSKSKILIVEDEPKVASFISLGLSEEGFIADIAETGPEGKDKILSQVYDLFIIDINLPGINGYELCKIIRQQNIQTPILILTALSRIDDKIKGFDYGADDYLVKPFEVRELIARIKALLKRSNATKLVSTIIKIADLEINRDEKKVYRKNQLITLSAKEYTLLEHLALNQDRVLSRIELINQVWGLGFDTGTNVVDVYINFLRRKMDNDYEPKLIHTRIGLGYVLTDKSEQ